MITSLSDETVEASLLQMSCHYQLALAQRLAANVGYVVVPDPAGYDIEVEGLAVSVLRQIAAAHGFELRRPFEAALEEREACAAIAKAEAHRLCQSMQFAIGPAIVQVNQDQNLQYMLAGRMDTAIDVHNAILARSKS